MFKTLFVPTDTAHCTGHSCECKIHSSRPLEKSLLDDCRPHNANGNVQQVHLLKVAMPCCKRLVVAIDAKDKMISHVFFKCPFGGCSPTFF